MIKKISIDQLRPGMYIQDLNCDWIDRPLLPTEFSVASEKQVLRIRALGIRELYIDVARGLDVETAAPTREEVEQELELELTAILEHAAPAASRVPLRQEWRQALRVRREADQVVGGIMEDVRLGRMVDAERAAPAVESLMGSVFRNQDALLGLTRIRCMDRYTFEHSVSVSVLLIAFARALGLELSIIREIGTGALLHDIGKIRTPPEILGKPGRLTEDEFAIMRDHVVHSRALLENAPGIAPASLAVAAQHHERFDGSGYPDGRRGAEISLPGQMAGIVDVYDAITSDRVYHKGMAPHEALRRMLEWSRHHFDPALVQRFIQCVGVYPVGSLVRLESGRLGVVVESSHVNRLRPVVRLALDLRTGNRLEPLDLDLSRPSGDGEDRILGIEPVDRWPIVPEEILARSD